MKRVAYLTGRSWRGTITIPPGTLPKLETPDFALVQAACAEQGISLEIRYWDEASLPHDGYDAAIIRSCWDYMDRYEEFVATVRSHEAAGLKLYNRADVLVWNASKRYLDDLGALAIPTLWADKVDAAWVARAFDTLDAATIVVKPQVGGGSRNTIKLSRNAWSEADLIDGPPGTAMAQPYLSAIETEGERSLIYFGGQFSHAIRKVPAEGKWFANQPGETRVFADAPPADAVAAATAALALAPRDLLYVRVDLVRADDGGWRVIEIEAVEPYLYLDFAREGAPIFASALTRVLSL